MIDLDIVSRKKLFLLHKIFISLWITFQKMSSARSCLSYGRFEAAVEHLVFSSPDLRARICCSPSKKPPFTLTAPGAYKIRHWCNFLHVPIQIMPLGIPKRGSHPLHGGLKLRGHVSGSSSG